MRNRPSTPLTRRSRPSRARTPTVPTEHIDAKRQQLKRQRLKQRAKQQYTFAALRAKRDHGAAIAAETHRIVFGDGQYVEERRVPVPSPVEAQTSRQVRRRSSRATSTAALPPFTTIPVAHDISMMIMLSRQGTSFYPHYSELLAMWAQNRPAIPRFKTRIVFNSISTLSAAHQLALSREPGAPRATVGVLSFASPKQPRGQFLQGGDEQEETVARLSSLEANLTSPAAQEFYREHRKYRAEDGSGLHDHSMVYSPGVVVFRRDSGDMLALVGEDSTATATILPRTEDPSAGEFIAPYTVNVVSAVPVHAGTVRSKHIILPSEEQLFDSGMRQVMKERMARALRLFEERCDRTVVLGAFGCGQSQNKADAVAGIWAELLVCGWIDEEGKKRPARFADSFEKVVLAVPGKWFADFKRAFDMRIFEERVAEAALTSSSGS